MAVPVARLRATVDRRATGDIAALRATAAREERQATAAADTIQRRVAVAADAPPVAVTAAAEVVDTREVVAAEDMEVTAKSLETLRL